MNKVISHENSSQIFDLDNFNNLDCKTVFRTDVNTSWISQYILTVQNKSRQGISQCLLNRYSPFEAGVKIDKLPLNVVKSYQAWLNIAINNPEKAMRISYYFDQWIWFIKFDSTSVSLGYKTWDNQGEVKNHFSQDDAKWYARSMLKTLPSLEDLCAIEKILWANIRMQDLLQVPLLWKMDMNTWGIINNDIGGYVWLEKDTHYAIFSNDRKWFLSNCGNWYNDTETELMSLILIDNPEKKMFWQNTFSK